MSKPGHRFTSDQLRLSATTRPTSAARDDCPTVSNDPTESQLTSIKHPAVSPRLDLRQLPSSNVQLRTSTMRLYQLTTSPILAEDYIQPPRTFTYMFVIPAIKSSLLLYLLSCLHCLWLTLHSHAFNLIYLRSRHAYRLHNTFIEI